MDKVIKFSVKDNDPSNELNIKKDIKDLIGFQDYRLIICQESDGIYTMMAFLNQSEVKGIKSIFMKYDMFIASWDVTDDVLSGRYREYCPEIFGYPVYKKVMSDFILDNATVNNILDKILEYGLDSLSDEDKIILENNSKS